MWHGLLTANFVGERHWVLEGSLTYELDDRISISKEDFNLWKSFGLVIKRKRVGSISKRREQFTITAPKGYDTDLASISRAIWSFISPWDVARAAVIHDTLYGALRRNSSTLDKKTISMLREQADNIFMLGMIDADPKIPNWKIKTCYRFVRVLGGISINRAAKF